MGVNETQRKAYQQNINNQRIESIICCLTQMNILWETQITFITITLLEIKPLIGSSLIFQNQSRIDSNIFDGKTQLIMRFNQKDELATTTKTSIFYQK